MNPDEYILFQKIQRRFFRTRFDRRLFIQTLLSRGVFPQQKSNVILNALSSNSSTTQILMDVMLDLPRHCSVETLILILKGVDQTLYKRCKKKLERSHIEKASRVVSVVPTRRDPSIKDNSFINTFYENLKARTLQNSTLNWKEQFTTWADRLCNRIHSPNVSFSERSKIADCAYALLDLTAVLEKLHEPNKAAIVSSPIFGKIEAVVPYTSDPTLSRLTYFARKGVAMAQAGHSSAQEYADMVLHGSSYFIRGRQIGTNIYAVVNIMLQRYASLTPEERQNVGNSLKSEILHWSNVGMEHFENEPKDVWNTWRRVCLDKIVYCRLGIDTLSRDIPGVQVSQEDVDIAKQCLSEMETLKIGMEKMRLIHFYVASAKAHKLTDEPAIANGYLKQALSVGEGEGYSSEINVISEKLYGTSHISSNREPVEHCEDDDNMTEDINANPPSVYRNRQQPCEHDSSLGALCASVSLLYSGTKSANDDVDIERTPLPTSINSNDHGADIVDTCVNTLSAEFNLCANRPYDFDS